LCPPPCSPGWPASPCTCNGLWLISCMAVSLKEKYGHFTEQWHEKLHIYSILYHTSFHNHGFYVKMVNNVRSALWVHKYVLTRCLCD
jgi:hypothetical protein